MQVYENASFAPYKGTPINGQHQGLAHRASNKRADSGVSKRTSCATSRQTWMKNQFYSLCESVGGFFFVSNVIIYIHQSGHARGFVQLVPLPPLHCKVGASK